MTQNQSNNKVSFCTNYLINHKTQAVSLAGGVLRDAITLRDARIAELEAVLSDLVKRTKSIDKMLLNETDSKYECELGEVVRAVEALSNNNG